jgi:hypothetical protein
MLFEGLGSTGAITLRNGQRSVRLRGRSAAPETLRGWVSEEASRRTGPAAQAISERDRLKALEREVKELHPAPDRSRAGPPGRQRWRQLRQRPCRDHQWSVQGRGHLAATVMARCLRSGNGDPAMGGLVQQSPPVRPHRTHPARRGRRQLLCSPRDPRYGCVAQMKTPPQIPGRFTLFWHHFPTAQES